MLTDKLSSAIAFAETLTAVEDLYLPYKKKRQTKAEVARKAGLEPLAKIIMSQRENDLDYKVAQFVKGDVKTQAAALEGAKFIIAEWVNENIGVRNKLRRLYERKASITSKVCLLYTSPSPRDA